MIAARTVETIRLAHFVYQLTPQIGAHLTELLDSIPDGLDDDEANAYADAIGATGLRQIIDSAFELATDDYAGGRIALEVEAIVADLAGSRW